MLSLVLDDIDGANEKSIWNLFYHFRIDKDSLSLLQNQTTKLLTLSDSLHTWQKGQYGPMIRICDHVSLERLSEMWRFYGEKREGDDLRRFEKKLDDGVKKSQEYQKSVVGEKVNIITGVRAAAPVCLDAARDMGVLYNNYWAFGTTDADKTARSLAVFSNPMFVPKDGNMFLHYGTDPVLGFHIGSCYVPIEPPSPLSRFSSEMPQLHDIVKSARTEFGTWMKSFRARSLADLITIRFFVGDAVAFAYTLQQTHTSGSSNPANWYRDRYHFQPLILDDDHYTGGLAPLKFDVIDTSNLIDHLGALNLLTATSPLLRHGTSAILYSEKLVRMQETGIHLLQTILCGDVTTVSSLLALVPVEVLTNTAPFSTGDEALCQDTSDASSQAGQVFARIAWKRPLNQVDAAVKKLALIHFSPGALAQLLYCIFLRIFADEDVSKLVSRMQKQQRPALPTYNRASYVAFLCLVKTRTSTDWHKTMEALLDLMDNDTGLAFANTYIQELTLWMHITGLYTVHVLRGSPKAVAGPQKAKLLQDWPNMPAMVSVTLKVPRDKLDFFITETIKAGYTPPLHGVLQSSDEAASQWQNMFAATQIGFGNLRTKGSRNSDSFELEIDEDKQGWSGNSSMLLSFYVPSWILLQEPQTATVALAIMHSPTTVNMFVRSLGPQLGIFAAKQQDDDHVYITKNLPHQSGVISIGGFSPGDVEDQFDARETSDTTMTATVEEKTGWISSFTSHVQIVSEQSKALLKEGSAIERSLLSPFNYSLAIEKGSSFHINFPAAVMDSSVKVRVARKSSYLELIADVANPTDWPTFRCFMYPVFLESGSPVLWNMPYLNISSLQIIDLASPSSQRLRWLKIHLPTMCSSHETTLKINPSLPASTNERTRVQFKDGLFHMFMGFSGVLEPRACVYGINCPEDQGVEMLVFVSKMLLDLSNRTVVLDAAVLPLHTALMPRILPALQAMSGSSHPPKIIRTSKDELRLWKEAAPAWTERCRSWSHKPNCEYVKTGKIPLSTETGHKILCSCGEGTVPADFMPNFAGWKDLAKHSVRAAISPCFASALISKPLDQSTLKLDRDGSGEDSTECRICGKSKKADGSDLMNCSRCHKAKYCSKDCQKADWKKHKGVCKSDGN